jgi:phage terminase small subunit
VYAPKSAATQGHLNLGKPHVARAIHESTNARIIRTEVTQDMVIEELRRIAFSDLRDLFTWDEERACFVPSSDLTPEQAAAVSWVKSKARTSTDAGGSIDHSLELELKTYDKLAALDKLGRHLGMFSERLELTGPGGAPVDVTVTRKIVDVAADADGEG